MPTDSLRPPTGPLRPDSRNWQSLTADFAATGQAIGWADGVDWLDEGFSDSQLRDLLDGDYARYRRATHAETRVRLLASRRFMKTLAARLLGVTVRLEPDSDGRPTLANVSGVDLNMSHTRDVIVVGVCRAGRIGVDVEWRDRKVYSAGFAGSVCSPVERSSLGDEPDQELIWLWTLKEAFAKARGDGLRLAFSRVHALRGNSIAVELDGEALPDWRFGSWTVDGSYRVAAAVENSQNEKVG